MANFKGFKQVSLETYLATSEQERKNYLWFVRDLSGDTASAIYFGNRLYAEVNNDDATDERVNNLLVSLGGLVDENGEWLGFLPFEEHELLGTTAVTSVSDALSVLEAAVLANADAIAGKVSQADYDDKVEELENALADKVDAADYEEKVAELEEKIDTISETTISAITEEVEAISEELETKASKDELEEVSSKVDDVDDKVDAVSAKTDELEEAVSAVTEILDTKADADDVYTKSEVYTKDEVDAKVAGVFHFAGSAESISADNTTIYLAGGEEVVAAPENEGYVYQIGDAEYASNGSTWEKLGFNIDLSEYATKDYVDSAITAEAAAREALADEVAEAQEAIAQEIQAREALAEEVVEVRNASTTTASTFSDAEEMDLQLGQIVYVVTSETVSGVTYMPGAYIYTQDGLKKLDSTTPSTSVTVEERVEALENNVGAMNTLLGDTAFEGDTITEAIAALQSDTTHEIGGDDVEE